MIEQQNFEDVVGYSYYNDSAYSSIYYSKPISIYTLTFGTISAIGNLFLVVLFCRYSKLRATQCNWLIIFLCITDVFIGIGTFVRPIISTVSMDNNILDFEMTWCAIASGSWIIGYRTGQSIALLMALDRFLAIWKPTFYAQKQGNIQINVLASLVLITIVFCFLLFWFLYGGNFSAKLTLQTCMGIPGIYYFQIVPSYSGIVSIIFIVTYSFSLILFMKQISYTKKQQAHSHIHISKVQRKIFITVSMALLFYTLFYVIPTIMQMLTKYVGLPTIIFDTANYIIVYGAELNGSLNAVIYLFKHQEFNECARKFIYRLAGKTYQAKMSSRIITNVKTVASSNIKSELTGEIKAIHNQNKAQIRQ